MNNDRRELIKTAMAGAAGIMAAELANAGAAKAADGATEPRFIPHDPPRRYSKASVYGKFIFLAGEDSKDPKTQEVRGADAGEQAEFALQNLERTLEGLGSSLAHIVKTTVLLVDPRDQPAFSKASAKYIHHNPPGTMIMGVQLADPRMLLEIEAIAIIPG